MQVPLLWDDDDDMDDIIVPEKRVILSNTAETPLLSDLSIQGEEQMKWTDDLSEGSSGRPKLLVTVASNNQVPADMQKRISPIVRTEMDEFSKKDVSKITVGQPATFTFGLGKKGNVAITSGSTSDVSVDGGEVSSFLGPHVQKEISVKTDYDIETSPPSPSPEDGGGLMYDEENVSYHHQRGDYTDAPRNQD